MDAADRLSSTRCSRSAIDVLKRTKSARSEGDPRSPSSATDYQSIVGPVKWNGQPVKNVTKTPLVAGQWQRKGDRLRSGDHAEQDGAEVPVGGKLELLS